MRMTCQGAPAPPLEDGNILSMILLRLPPLPSSLPRASLVCKPWRRLITDPRFHRRFLAHHKKAPLLGFFFSDYDGRIGFRPAQDPPNRIPAERLSSLQLGVGITIILGCHHGRLLVLNFREQHFVVWDPITGDHHHVDIPQMLKENKILGRHGVVVCASREENHVHGACHAEPFQVVLIGCNKEGVFAFVYSSEAGTWGNLISLLLPPQPDMAFHLIVPVDCRSSLVGNSVYWVPVGMMGAALEFNLHSQTIAIIDAPPNAFNFNAFMEQRLQPFIVPADGGGISFIVLAGFSVHVWKRVSNGDGDAGWVFKNTVELSSLLSLKPRDHRINTQEPLKILGLDEDDNVIFRSTNTGVIYMVHLETLQFKVLSVNMNNSEAYPFSSFYTGGK